MYQVRSLAICAMSLFAFGFQSASAQYAQNNLSSDVSGVAAYTIPELQNPWGVSFSPTGPFWISNQASGEATILNGAGSPLGLVVSIPTPAGASQPIGPTGTVFNEGAGTGSFNGDLFLFSTLSGQIAGWKPAYGTSAATEFLNLGAVYTGLASGNSSGPNLYAADFKNGNVDVVEFIGTSFNLRNLPGNFTDPNLPAGYVPFNIQNLNDQLFVTFALQDASGNQPLAGAGLGFVDVFNLDGSFASRLISNGALNAPWGLAIAPSDFGEFSNDLLVGNHGDGTIWAFDLNGALIGQMKDAQGNPIVNPGLFALMFGNGSQGFNADSLYFSAGINGGANGLFGEISATPLPGAFTLFASGLSALVFLFGRRRKSERAAMAAA